MINKNKFLLVCVLEEIRLRECRESARKKRNHNKYVKQPKSMQINAVIARTWLGFYAATCAHVGRPPKETTDNLPRRLESITLSTR